MCHEPPRVIQSACCWLCQWEFDGYVAIFPWQPTSVFESCHVHQVYDSQMSATWLSLWNKSDPPRKSRFFIEFVPPLFELFVDRTLHPMSQNSLCHGAFKQDPAHGGVFLPGGWKWLDQTDTAGWRCSKLHFTQHAVHMSMVYSLVVSTSLKNNGQTGLSFPINIWKNVPDHQPDVYIYILHQNRTNADTEHQKIYTYTHISWLLHLSCSTLWRVAIYDWWCSLKNTACFWQENIVYVIYIYTYKNKYIIIYHPCIPVENSVKNCEKACAFFGIPYIM